MSGMRVWFQPSMVIGRLVPVSLAVFLATASGAGSASAGSAVGGGERAARFDVLRTQDLLAVHATDSTGDDARLGADGREDTWWTGRPSEAQWRWSAAFVRPVHLGVVRARFGSSSTSGVPTEFHWEVRPPSTWATTCDPDLAPDNDGWTVIEEADQPAPPLATLLAEPTRRSWFIDADACALRLVIDRTTAGPPVVREVQAIESARDVLRNADASDDGAYPGFLAADAVDGTYEHRWAGATGKSRWVLRLALRDPEPIDRVRLVLGFDATTVPRSGGGRSYAIAWAPVRYTLEASEDGRRFVPVASEPRRKDGTILPLRRRLVKFAEPRTVRVLRLVMEGAVGQGGVPEPGAVPVIREISAYRADDARPILAAPWILSVNANPSAQSHTSRGGEWTNDVYHAKFLQRRFAQLLPALRRDDVYARALGSRGELLDASPGDGSGEALESIEGDDPQLDEQLLAESSPPPITVLSGSNDWDYASATGPDPTRPRQWRWDPLRDARAGGMGQLGSAVRDRVAPFMGFCGGAQILALLEARRGGDAASPDDDQRLIDLVLRRTSGRPIRGFAQPIDVERSWPGDPHPKRALVRFLPEDPLFVDLAGPLQRSTTQSLPESHVDAVRPDAFLAGGPLERLEIVATSAFCAPDVVAASSRDGVFPDPAGAGSCDTVPEAFRTRESVWPIIGTQFHAEQREFSVAGAGDPPESVADPRLFLASAFEELVDAYVRLAQ
jgi:hypothetical protein